MIVKNLSANKFVQHGDLGQRLKLQVFNELETAAGFMHFTAGWLHLPTCFPITGDGITCKKLFSNYQNVKKLEGVYVPVERLRYGTYSSELEGVCAIGGDNNYWHFMTERVPQLFFLKDPELANRQIAHAYIKTNLEFCRYILERLGIQNRAFVEIPMNKPYGGWCDGPQFLPIKDVVIPSIIHRHFAPFLWDTYLWPQAERPSPKGRRLFVGREAGTRRQLLNQDEVVKQLEAEGFESVNPGAMSIQEQMQLFAESEFVIGVHGAALTNILFVPTDCRVVELTNGIKYFNFALISKVRDLDYSLVMGAPDGVEGRHTDFTVELDEIRQLVIDK